MKTLTSRRQPALRRLVRELDRARATPSRVEPERLMMAARGPSSVVQICVKCRRVPQEHAFEEYRRSWTAAKAAGELLEEHIDWRQLVERCPHCGGDVVEVER